MNSERLASQETRLEHLPSEILTLIASYADPTTATSLSVTSSAFQVHAEKRIWETLSVQPRDLVPVDARDPPPAPVAGTRATHVHPHGTVPIQDGCFSALLLGKILRTMNEKLDSYPWRAAAVRSLDLQLRHTVPSELAYLLTRLAGSLTKLIISMPYSAMALPEVATYVPLTQIFASLPVLLVSLERVHMSLQLAPSLLVSALLAAAPRLKHLNLHNQHSPRLHGLDHADLVTEQTSELFPTMLESLSVDHPSTIAPLLAALVERSPDLRRVGLNDPTFAWWPTPGDELLSAMAALENLESVVLPCTVIPVLPPGFCDVQDLLITWYSGALLQHDAVDLIIPAFPRLQTYQLDISVHMARTSSVHLLRASPHRQAMSLLRRLTPTHIAATSQLTAIYCPSHVDLKRTNSTVQQHGLFHTDHAFGGMALYSFRHESTGDELVHLRLHTPSIDAPCKGSRCLVCPVGWDDQAWFRDKEVPARVLNAAYAAGNVDIKRLAPGRGRTMDKEGWGVLQYWCNDRDMY